MNLRLDLCIIMKVLYSIYMYVYFYDSIILYKVNIINIMYYVILLYYILESVSNF